jgi:hypothetical protein
MHEQVSWETPSWFQAIPISRLGQDVEFLAFNSGNAFQIESPVSIYLRIFVKNSSNFVFVLSLRSVIKDNCAVWIGCCGWQGLEKNLLIWTRL